MKSVVGQERGPPPAVSSREGARLRSRQSRPGGSYSSGPSAPFRLFLHSSSTPLAVCALHVRILNTLALVALLLPAMPASAAAPGAAPAGPYAGTLAHPSALFSEMLGITLSVCALGLLCIFLAKRATVYGKRKLVQEIQDELCGFQLVNAPDGKLAWTWEFGAVVLPPRSSKGRPALKTIASLKRMDRWHRLRSLGSWLGMVSWEKPAAGQRATTQEELIISGPGPLCAYQMQNFYNRIRLAVPEKLFESVHVEVDEEAIRKVSHGLMMAPPHERLNLVWRWRSILDFVDRGGLQEEEAEMFDALRNALIHANLQALRADLRNSKDAQRPAALALRTAAFGRAAAEDSGGVSTREIGRMTAAAVDEVVETSVDGSRPGSFEAAGRGTSLDIARTAVDAALSSLDAAKSSRPSLERRGRPSLERRRRDLGSHAAARRSSRTRDDDIPDVHQLSVDPFAVLAPPRPGGNLKVVPELPGPVAEATFNGGSGGSTPTYRSIYPSPTMASASPSPTRRMRGRVQAKGSRVMDHIKGNPREPPPGSDGVRVILEGTLPDLVTALHTDLQRERMVESGRAAAPGAPGVSLPTTSFNHPLSELAQLNKTIVDRHAKESDRRSVADQDSFREEMEGVGVGGSLEYGET
mmetsp:Transcript_8947/g.29605  ORF Transcript_8947/g.29605 Transcript_8947/m.29605 type:complete len:640 (-) Transcript_8947:47-1966(-)